MKKKIYILENLGCANCAAKIERKINDLPEVENASITFATKQLHITAVDPDALLDTIQKIANSIEPGIFLAEKTNEKKASSQCACHSHCEPHSYCESHTHCEPHSHDHDNCHGAKESGESHAEACCLKEDNDDKKEHIRNISLSTPYIQIAFGIGFFLLGVLLENLQQHPFSVIAFIIAYLILGGKIVWTAFQNLVRGQIFDENFLMTLATLGAFAIQEFPEAVGVMLFFRIGEFFEEKAVQKTRSQIMDAVDLRPEMVTLVSRATDDNMDDTETDIKPQIIPAEEAHVGDIIFIHPGDRVPLDSIVIEGESRLDTSAITGEPVPVKVGVGDFLTSGCVNTSGLLKVRVEKVLADSMVSRILESVENAAASKPKIDRFITRFARIYTPFVVILAILTAVLPSLFTGDWNYWIYTALSFLVISCPCALVLSVPLAFFSGIGAGSKRGILFKGGAALEAMKSIKAVVMDKTGTVTKGNFAVQDIAVFEEELLHRIHSSQDEKNELSAKEILLLVAASCESSSKHPIAASITAAAKEKNLTLETPASLEEITGLGIKASLSFGDFFIGNKKLMEQKQISLSAISKEALGTEVFLAYENKILGSIQISDTIKEEAPAAIQKIKKLGLFTAMLTGDKKESADMVAKQTGIELVYAELLPEDKVSGLNHIRDDYGAVMFVGDGMNDAPVLAGADVGAAMGNGTDAALEAADLVFLTSRIDAIPEALSIAHKTNRIAKQNVIVALGIKALIMILGIAGFASMWMAVFADTGVAMLCVLNSIRVLYQKNTKK